MAASHAQSEGSLKEGFFRDFQREVAALKAQMERLDSTSPSGSERSAAIDECLAGIDRLSHDVMNASTYIPAYDQRTYSQAIKSLSEKLQAIRNSSNPPRKFQFKSRKNASTTSTPDAARIASPEPRAPISAADSLSANDSSSPPDKPLQRQRETQQDAPVTVGEDSDDWKDDGTTVRRPKFLKATQVTISKRNSLRIAIPASASHATSSGTLSDISNCIIDLSAPSTNAPFSALYLKNLKDSLVICGRVAGAIHITNIEHTVLVLSCRQFRMHGSKNVDVYLHSASRPIIEDCQNIRFAPLSSCFSNAEIEQLSNQWDQIDDFKWLKMEPSPHFSILPEAERVSDDVWMDKVMGEKAEHWEDVLKGLLP